MKPQEVRSPRGHWTLIDVLLQAPDWSLAVGEWDGRRRLAARWNGDAEHPKGNPVSHGVPTWFMLPDEFIPPLLAAGLLSPSKESLARAWLAASVNENAAADTPGFDLDALVAQITDENRHKEVRTGPARGNEFA